MAEWFFRKKGRNEVERDPGWDEYFTSNRSTDESLVREAIQNSLDALGGTEFPVLSGGDYVDEDRDKIRAWIDSAVAAFVKNRNLTQMANEWEGE